MQLFCKLRSSGSSDPYHFGGTRSVLSWETIVHYPRYKFRGQIRLKDTTLSLGSELLSNYCLYCRFVFFKYFMFLVLNEHGNYNLKTSLVFFCFHFCSFFLLKHFFRFTLKCLCFLLSLSIDIDVSALCSVCFTLKYLFSNIFFLCYSLKNCNNYLFSNSALQYYSFGVIVFSVNCKSFVTVFISLCR